MKKQLLKTIIANSQCLGIIVGLGIPGCNDPIGDMAALTALRSCMCLHENRCVPQVGGGDYVTQLQLFLYKDSGLVKLLAS